MIVNPLLQHQSVPLCVTPSPLSTWPGSQSILLNGKAHCPALGKSASIISPALQRQSMVRTHGQQEFRKPEPSSPRFFFFLVPWTLYLVAWAFDSVCWKSNVFDFLSACQGQWEWIRLYFSAERYYLDIQSVRIKVGSSKFPQFQQFVCLPWRDSRRLDTHALLRRQRLRPSPSTARCEMSDFVVHLCRWRNRARGRSKRLPSPCPTHSVSCAHSWFRPYSPGLRDLRAQRLGLPKAFPWVITEASTLQSTQELLFTAGVRLHTRGPALGRVCPFPGHPPRGGPVRLAMLPICHKGALPKGGGMCSSEVFFWRLIFLCEISLLQWWGLS